jgi:hypothetical protein
VVTSLSIIGVDGDKERSFAFGAGTCFVQQPPQRLGIIACCYS